MMWSRSKREPLAASMHIEEHAPRGGVAGIAADGCRFGGDGVVSQAKFNGVRLPLLVSFRAST